MCIGTLGQIWGFLQCTLILTAGTCLEDFCNIHKSGLLNHFSGYFGLNLGKGMGKNTKESSF